MGKRSSQPKSLQNGGNGTDCHAAIAFFYLNQRRQADAGTLGEGGLGEAALESGAVPVVIERPLEPEDACDFEQVCLQLTGTVPQPTQ